MKRKMQAVTICILLLAALAATAMITLEWSSRRKPQGENPAIRPPSRPSSHYDSPAELTAVPDHAEPGRSVAVRPLVQLNTSATSGNNPEKEFIPFPDKYHGMTKDQLKNAWQEVAGHLGRSKMEVAAEYPGIQGWFDITDMPLEEWRRADRLYVRRTVGEKQYVLELDPTLHASTYELHDEAEWLEHESGYLEDLRMSLLEELGQ